VIKAVLTGGIATGKSYVSTRLREAGVPLVDADVLSREVVAPGTTGLAAVVRRFGREVLTSEGLLNRVRLGHIIFRDPAARRELEEIVHPAVRDRIQRFFDSLPRDTPIAVADIPLFFETGKRGYFDKIIVVACPREMQLERIGVRDGLSREDAERRLAAQLPIDEKVKHADYVIRTDGTVQDTDRQVQDLLTKLRSRKR
jgi:dephospho-CoA kinase